MEIQSLVNIYDKISYHETYDSSIYVNPITKVIFITIFKGVLGDNIGSRTPLPLSTVGSFHFLFILRSSFIYSKCL